MGRAAWFLGAMLAAAVPLCGSAAAQSAAPARLALVIGNSAYTGIPAAPGCASSAHVVTAALQRAGYTVTERLDQSNGQMGATLSDFADALVAAPGASAVLYACGYVVGYDGRVFLLPISATLDRPTDALTQGLVGRLPINTVVRSKVKAGLVLLDTLALPKSEAEVPLASLIDAKTMTETGFVAVRTSAPHGPSAMAAAVAAAFAEPNVELRATVERLAAAFPSPSAVGLAAHEPAATVYLAGGPPVANAVATVAPAGAEEPAVLSIADRRRAQLALQRLGYFRGRVDGAFGADTLVAVRRFQTENGMTPTGKLAPDQFARLLEDGR